LLFSSKICIKFRRIGKRWEERGERERERERERVREGYTDT
jgi:hypothetical protein